MGVTDTLPEALFRACYVIDFTVFTWAREDFSAKIRAICLFTLDRYCDKSGKQRR